MTHEEFIRKSLEIEETIKSLREERNSLWLELLKTCPFKPGDKVLVKNTGKETVCFIGDIKEQYFLKIAPGPFRYDFLACKKDGTMSMNSAGVYSYNSIELV